MSVNVANCRRSTLGLAASVSVRSGKDWSPWFWMLRWGHPVIADGVLSAPQGHVDVDELQLSGPAEEVRCRVSWQSTDRGCELRRVALCMTHRSEWQTSSAASVPVRMDVPFLSQWDAQAHEGRRVCSPTCLAMVAQYHGLPVTVDDVATLAFDRSFSVYGNWTASMLAMSLLGFRATVERAQSLQPLDQSLDSGNPVVTSIAFGAGELSGSPIQQTRGHLIVICGRTENGDFLARDPAARGEEDWRQYSRAEFERAWLGHGGVYYRIAKDSE